MAGKQGWVYSIIKSSLIIVVLVSFVEWWQGKDMYKGDINHIFTRTSYQTLTGKSINFAELKGNFVLYAFAPWCGVCRMTASSLNDLDLGDSSVIAVALNWSSRETVEKFRDDTGMEIPIILGNDRHIRSLGVEGFPSYFIVRDGQVVRSWPGYTSGSGLKIKYWLSRVIGI